MKCPHCSVSYHEAPETAYVNYGSNYLGKIDVTKCPACSGYTAFSSIGDNETRFSQGR